MTDKALLVDSWNRVFSESVSPNRVADSESVDQLFNDYLRLVVANHSYSLREDTCLVDKVEYKYYVYFARKSSVDKVEFDVRSKRKFFSTISGYSTVITRNFPLQDSSRSDKTILRYEVVRNILTSNNTHFFSLDLPFPVDDYTVFFTENFYRLLLSNLSRFNLLKFSSALLNSFETGLTVDNFVLKPSVNVSRYGRWYWSNTEKIQSSLNVRSKLYSRVVKYGRVLNVDFISAEPTLLSKLCDSELMRKLVKYRVAVRKSNPEVSDAVKNLLNIYIHSNDSPAEAFRKFKRKYDSKQVESVFGVSIFDILSCLQDDFLCYNRHVTDSYRTSLSVEEFYRRVVNPGVFTCDDREVIKEHRKFLQGHVHDHVLELARLVSEDLSVLPIFTIHDSLSYFVPRDFDLDRLKDSLSKGIKRLGISARVEIID